MEGDIRDIKGLMTTPGLPLPWLLALVVVLALVAIAFYVWKRRKPSTVATVPILAPGEEARQSLQRLRSQSLVSAEEIKQFHFALSEICRRYLERRFNIPATDRTLEELKPLLPQLPLNEENRESIRRLLDEADLVKFTDWNPGPEKSVALCESALRFVEKTPEPPPSASNPGGSG
jgi:hypothetical protein